MSVHSTEWILHMNKRQSPISEWACRGYLHGFPPVCVHMQCVCVCVCACAWKQRKMKSIITILYMQTIEWQLKSACTRGPCTLCTKNSKKYKHCQDLTLEEGVIFRYKRTHSDLSCICYPCMKQIGRFIQNPNSNACPRWLQNQPTSTGVCNITSCHAKVHANTRLGTPSEIEQLLAVKVEAFTVLEITSISVGLIV